MIELFTVTETSPYLLLIGTSVFAGAVFILLEELIQRIVDFMLRFPLT